MQHPITLAFLCVHMQSRTGAGSSVDAFGWNSIVIGGPLDPSSQVERRLAAGAGIACRLRGALREQMGAICRCLLLLVVGWGHGLPSAHSAA